MDYLFAVAEKFKFAQGGYARNAVVEGANGKLVIGENRLFDLFGVLYDKGHGG